MQKGDTHAHFELLLSLIEVERNAERAENERKLVKMPVQMREALGKTVTRLVLSREDFGVGGHTLWVLSRPSHGEEFSPFQALNQGDLVMLSFQDLAAAQGIKGTLYDIDEFEITVALDGAPPAPTPKGRCQLDVLGSEATYKRMKKALVSVQQAQKKSVAHLRDVFMGDEEAGFDEKPEIEFFNKNLNDYQREAVRRALAAKEAA